MRVVSACLRPYALRLRAPLTTAVGTHQVRRGWLLAIEDQDGRVGWGDAAPWPGFGAGVEATRADLERIGRGLPVTVGSVEEAGAIAWELARASEARHALELALLDLLAQRALVPLCRLLDPEAATVVSVHALVSDGAAASAAVASGFRSLKVKVGGLLADDVARVSQVRRAAGSVPLRLDANAAWTVEAALRAVRALAPYEPEFVEQPVAAADVAGLARVRAEGRVPIAADEAVFDARSLDAVIDLRAASVVVLKPMFTGGVLTALALARRARGAGLEVVVTNALEAAVGRAGALHLAAALRAGPCGLGTVLAEDVAALPDPTGGLLLVPAAPGLGVAP